MCSEDDYDGFYPPAENSINSINFIRNNNFNLYCIDDGQDILIFGRDNFDMQRLEVLYQPC